MKKLFLLSSVFAVALLTGCKDDDIVNNGEVNGEGGKDHYIAVNIVSTPDAGTRAAVSGSPSGAQYEEGTELENKVEKVRFYFFDSSGNPASVRHDSNLNYFDWEKPVEEGKDMPNVSKQLKAVLLISTKDGDELPDEIIAVVNPQTKDLDNKSMSRLDLRSVTADYATMANATDPKFPMVNSVYLGNDGNVVRATKVTADFYMDSPEAAEKKPVIIYVERNVAKVQVKLDNTTLKPTADGLIKLQTKKDNVVSDLTVGDKQVYLKLNGWNVTADLDLANLSKRIDASWETDILGAGTVWNYAPYFRSYWAQEVVKDQNKADRVNRYYNFDNAKAKAFGTGYTYANENGERNKDSKRAEIKATKVIVNGTLCDENGDALTICEYYGIKFIDDKDQSSLKSSILTHLEENGDYYYKVTNLSDGKKAYTAISTSDIEFITATAAGKLENDGKGSYYVFPALKAEAQDLTKIAGWVKTKDVKLEVDAEGNLNLPEDKIISVQAATIDDLLRNSQHAKIWNTGDTYYYANIQHFGMEGLVRNHIYDMTIGSIFGLGTPVYDPTEVIIPEKPVEEDTYIAAQINILSWRIVPNKVSFEW